MPVQLTSGFLERTRDAKKVMVLDLGFLGDTVHLLPALWMVRQAYPQAELHVAVAAHVTSLMDCVPWVDKTWGYMRFPRHANLRENYQMVAALRREKFDVLINLNGSDRSSWLTLFSGARERLGRVPGDGGPLLWRRMFTAHVEHPFKPEPIYIQRCRCLEMSGFPPPHRNFMLKLIPPTWTPPGFPQRTPELIFTSARLQPPIARNCRRRSLWNWSPRWKKNFRTKKSPSPAHQPNANLKKWKRCWPCCRKNPGASSPAI